MYRVSTLFLTPDCYIVLENFIFVSFQLMEEKKKKLTTFIKLVTSILHDALYLTVRRDYL